MANSATQIGNFCIRLLPKPAQKRELRTCAAFLKTFLLRDIPTLGFVFDFPVRKANSKTLKIVELKFVELKSVFLSLRTAM
jgi:hypothetical protein